MDEGGCHHPEERNEGIHPSHPRRNDPPRRDEWPMATLVTFSVSHTVLRCTVYGNGKLSGRAGGQAVSPVRSSDDCRRSRMHANKPEWWWYKIVTHTFPTKWRNLRRQPKVRIDLVTDLHRRSHNGFLTCVSLMLFVLLVWMFWEWFCILIESFGYKCTSMP